MLSRKSAYQNLNLISHVDKFRQTGARLLYLFTNARDEPKIAEWIAHHLLLGFDKIHVFDHKSVTPISNTIGSLINDKRVSITRVEMDGSIKLDLMTRAVQISQKNNVSWMLYLDADEFLLLNNFNNVRELLNAFNFADAIGVNWLMFGSSHHVSQPPGLLMENFTMSDKLINQHVKSFVRPDKVILPAVNPHFFNMVNPNRYFAATLNKMVQGPFNPIPRIFTKVTAYIAHYYTQSEAEYNRRKGRVLDDGTTKGGLGAEIHTIHNEVGNNQLQNKYSHRTKVFLLQHGIVL
jgi:hypothetical protein